MEALSRAAVGRTALQVSRVGLGTAFLAGSDGQVPEEQAVETVHAALNNGVSLIDTAPLYGRGRSEELLGRALRGVPRESFVLSTKVGRLVSPQREVTFAYTRDGALRSLEESLRRRRLDHADIVLMHDPDRHYRAALEEVYPALAALREQGVVKAIGAGMNQWQMLADFARHADLDCFLLAGRYTLLEQGALETFLPLCRQKGIGVFLGGIFNSGILATGPRVGASYDYGDAPPAILKRARRIEEVCLRHGVPLPTAAVQFPLAHPAVTAVVIGAQSPGEVAANLAAVRRPIPSALWSDLRRDGLLGERAPVP